jgi:hypothetical protein
MKESTLFLLYKTSNNDIKVDVLIQNETLWLNQKQIAELFAVNVPAIAKHIKNILDDGELHEATISKMEIVQKEGNREVKRNIDFYNLDMIIAVGYRVNSKQATHFRIWTTNVLKEYIIKGFAMDDERLKNPNNPFGKDYFEEQLARIRDIRSSERRFYQKITDIYAQCSADYDASSELTQNFFASVQNKLHWAIVGETAAEIIYNRANSQKENMGLTNWKNAPDGRIRKTDVTVAKNYLDKEHLESLNRIVSAYLDLAENRASRKIVMHMQDWIIFLNKFLDMADYPTLEDNGKISALEAKLKAEGEYEKYKVIEDKNYFSDFDILLDDLK